MKSSLWIAMVMMAVAFSACAGKETATNTEAEAVKTVVREAYVRGIQIDRDVEAIRKGFDPAFNILILQDDEISEYPIETWIKGIEASLETDPGPRE